MKINLEGLNSNQLDAVEWNNGSLLVLAGPGSGKTKVLTLRTARLLDEYAESSVLALTFTTKAADEMRERLGALLGGKSDRVQIGTFHSFAGDILRQFGSSLGIKPDFVILTTDEDRIAFIEKLLTSGEDHEPPSYAAAIPRDRKSLLTLLDRLFSESYDGGEIVPGFSSPQPWIPDFFKDYCATLVAANRLDFGALVHMARRVLIEDPSSSKILRYGWSHICVDEFQDTNKAQYDLLNLVLKGGEPNLFVVADDDQILYQWNGASPERLLALRSDFDVECIQLPRNYRCPPAIIDLANRLIIHNKTRTPDKSKLIADRERVEGDEIFAHVFPNEDAEADGVAALILQRDLSADECVILARNGKILSNVAKALENAGLKTWLPQRKNEFESGPARWFHSILRLGNSRHDREFLRRVCVAWQEIGNGLIEVNAVEAEAAINGGDFLRAWLVIARLHSTNPLLAFIERYLAERSEFGELIPLFWDEFSTSEDLLIKDEIAVWKELDVSLKGKIDPDDLTLNHYLQEMDMLSKALPKPDGAIPCITIHGSKGGEFKHVFLVGMAEEVFPSYHAVKAGKTSSEMEEDRRSCFVAITRVQKTLTVTWAQSYYGWPKRPSRFLSEMGIAQAL